MKKRFLDKCKQISEKAATKLVKLPLTREDLFFIAKQSNRTWDVMESYNKNYTHINYIHIQKYGHRFEYFAFNTKEGLLIKENDREILNANYYIYKSTIGKISDNLK